MRPSRPRERYAHLRGLDAPLRGELAGPGGGPIVTYTLTDHPTDHLSPAEEARRYRRLAEDLEVDLETDVVDGVNRGASVH